MRVLCTLFNLLMVGFVADDRTVEIVLVSSRYGGSIFKKNCRKICNAITVCACLLQKISATQTALQILEFGTHDSDSVADNIFNAKKCVTDL